jgi:hypothetical protein
MLHSRTEDSFWPCCISGGRPVACFALTLPDFKPGSSHVGYVVDTAAQGQILSEFFGLTCQSFIFTDCSTVITIYYPVLVL